MPSPRLRRIKSCLLLTLISFSSQLRPLASVLLCAEYGTLHIDSHQENTSCAPMHCFLSIQRRQFSCKLHISDWFAHLGDFCDATYTPIHSKCTNDDKHARFHRTNGTRAGTDAAQAPRFPPKPLRLGLSGTAPGVWGFVTLVLFLLQHPPTPPL